MLLRWTAFMLLAQHPSCHLCKYNKGSDAGTVLKQCGQKQK